MSSEKEAWVEAGRGQPPRLTWSLSTEGELRALQLARESSEVLAADALGGLYLVDRCGKLVRLTHGKTGLKALAWSDNGHGGAALVGDRTLYWFDRELVFQGRVELPQTALAVTITPQGEYVAVALDDGFVLVYDQHRRRVRHIQAPQPLVAVRFLAEEPALLGIAEFGLLCRFEFTGDLAWTEKLWGNVADLAVSGDGGQILLASYAYGVPLHDATGEQRGSYQLGGTACRVASSYAPQRVAVATLEGHFYWLDKTGQVLWETRLPDDCIGLACCPLGTGAVLGLSTGRLIRLDWNR